MTPSPPGNRLKRVPLSGGCSSIALLRPTDQPSAAGGKPGRRGIRPFRRRFGSDCRRLEDATLDGRPPAASRSSHEQAWPRFFATCHRLRRRGRGVDRGGAKRPRAGVVLAWHLVEDGAGQVLGRCGGASADALAGPGLLLRRHTAALNDHTRPRA